MFGTLYHILFGKLVYEKLCDCGVNLDLPKFMSGNLLPDLAKDKDSAHCYIKGHIFVPNLDAAKTCYAYIDDISLLSGVLAHLWLDRYFIDNLLSEKFEVITVSVDEQYIRNIDGPHFYLWLLDNFFSLNGIYRAYLECSPLILERESISMEWIKANVPYEIPPTGLPVLDNRIEDNWLDCLELNLEKSPEYTGELLSIDEMTNLIKSSVDDFVSYIICEILQFSKVDRIKLSPFITIPGKCRVSQETMVVFREPDRFNAHWATLQEGIIEIILGKPNMSANLKAVIKNFIVASCELYQSYRKDRQYDDDLHLDVPDFVNDVARNGFSHYSRELKTFRTSIPRALFMNMDYPNTLNDIFSDLNRAPSRLIKTDKKKKRVKLLTDILEALVAADGDIYRLVVSYSNY